MNTRKLLPTALLLGALALGLILAPGAPALAQDDASAAAGLLAVDSAWAKAETDGDHETSMSFIHPDVLFFAPNSPMTSGFDACKAAFESMWAMPGFWLKWVPAGADVAASGDLGYTWGTYTLKFSDEDGEAEEDRGKYLTVWKKDASGAWKAIADTYNTNLPPEDDDDDDASGDDTGADD